MQFGNHVIDPFDGTDDCRNFTVNVIEIHANTRAGIIDFECYLEMTILRRYRPPAEETGLGIQESLLDRHAEMVVHLYGIDECLQLQLLDTDEMA